MNGYARWTGRQLRLQLHVQPRAKTTEFAGQFGERLKVRLNAPPVDGKANAELIRFLARAFGIGKSQVRISQGQHGRDKTVLLDAPQTLPPDLNLQIPQ